MLNKGGVIASTRKHTSQSTGYRQNDAWWLRALCLGYDPDLWFPTADRANAYAKPRKICQACPVRRQCLEDALEADHRYGMFGGLTPGERDKIRQQRGGSNAA